MNDHIKLFAKISSKVIAKWLLIFITGNIVTLITFLVAIFTNAKYAGGGHGSPIALVIGLFTQNIFAFFVVIGAPIFLALYFILANKISIQNALYQLWKTKAGDYISDKVENITSKFTEKDGWKTEITNKAILQAKILQETKSDPDTSKLQRKIINYGFKKINLDDINFKDENLKLSHILKVKFYDFISNTAKPSLKLFWILIFLQIFLLIVSFLLK
ncbi:hypothetical protein [Kaistella carnis]|uniref:Uncharacterized protein n=1 Tax=Kaistella carnis TaxID=1241979 RepID=A0A3G8XKD0_9FLAO|nr:hypothetical protein [Kaistella carnis]AZI32953.1 hypothetical protein EIB73_07105 [Kaistella carnis]